MDMDTQDTEDHPIISSLSALTFAYDNMVAENLVGSGLELWLCGSVYNTESDTDMMESCVLRLKQGMRDVNLALETSGTRTRSKRSTACCASQNFRRNHFPQSGDTNLVVRNRFGKNTRILTPRQEVYRQVANKLETGDWRMVEHQGKAQRAVTLEGLRMVDEVNRVNSQLRIDPRQGPVQVLVNEQGQLVHLQG